jgi:hypothetical protein
VQQLAEYLDYIMSLLAGGAEPPSVSNDDLSLPFEVIRANVTEFGLLSIQYNQPIEIVKEAFILEYDARSDIEVPVNYSYNVTQTGEDYVKIQMDFTEPLIVSSGYTADILNVFLPVEAQKDGEEERRLGELVFIKVPIPLPQ